MSAVISWGFGGDNPPHPLSLSLLGLQTQKREMCFVSWVPGAVATVYIHSLPLPWLSLASKIGFPVFSLLFGLSNLDCSLKNSVVLCSPLSGFRCI